MLPSSAPLVAITLAYEQHNSIMERHLRRDTACSFACARCGEPRPDGQPLCNRCVRRRGKR